MSSGVGSVKWLNIASAAVLAGRGGFPHLVLAAGRVRWVPAARSPEDELGDIECAVSPVHGEVGHGEDATSGNNW